MKHFTIEKDSNADGATPYPLVTSEDDCAKLCKHTHNCVAFDYDNNDPPLSNTRCWIHDKANLAVEAKTGINHHIAWDFTYRVNHNANIATPNYGISTVSGCATRCVETPDCFAFDFDRKDPPYKNASCWIHTERGIVVKPEHGVDHYALGSCSKKGSSQVLLKMHV